MEHRRGCRSGSFQANCPELKHAFEITGMRFLKQKQSKNLEPLIFILQLVIATSLPKVLSETFVM